MKSPVFFLGAVALLSLSGAGPLAAEVPADSAAAATLHLSNGDYLAGELRDCGEAGVLRWQAPAFAAPLGFPLGAVSAVFFPARGARPRPDGGYCLELEGGDILFGSLVGLSKEDCRFDAVDLGLGPRQALRRPPHFARSPGGRSALFGAQWPVGMEADSRRRLETGCRPDFHRPGPGIARWRSWPAETSVRRFRLVLDIGSRLQPGLWARAKSPAEPRVVPVRGRRVVPASDDTPPDNGAFRVEVFSTHLVLLCERGQKADLAPLQKIAPGAGRCHFRIYLDQEHNRAIAFAADGKPLADLSVADVPPPAPAQGA